MAGVTQLAGEVWGLVCTCFLKPQAVSRPQLDRSTREVELGLDYGTPTMNLAGQSLKFENGQWIAGGLMSCRGVCRDGGSKAPA